MRRDHAFHEDFIPFLVNRLGAKCYLELGCYALNTLRRVKNTAAGCRCIGVDIKKWEIDYSGIEFINTTTDEFFTHCEGIEPDVIFIDAAHDAESVRKDFNNSWKILRPEGLILCHDTNPERQEDTEPGLCGDAWKFAKHITSDGLHEAITLPYHPGLTIVRRRDKWGPTS